MGMNERLFLMLRMCCRGNPMNGWSNLSLFSRFSHPALYVWARSDIEEYFSISDIAAVSPEALPNWCLVLIWLYSIFIYLFKYCCITLVFLVSLLISVQDLPVSELPFQFQTQMNEVMLQLAINCCYSCVFSFQVYFHHWSKFVDISITEEQRPRFLNIISSPCTENWYRVLQIANLGPLLLLNVSVVKSSLSLTTIRLWAWL